MLEFDEIVALARHAARAGHPPHAIFQAILPHFERRYEGLPFIDLDRCLMEAFAIPLRYARDSEEWTGLSNRGTMADAAIDDLFAPWVERWLSSASGAPGAD